MSRPTKKWPRKNVISCRLSDPEFEVLRFYAQQIQKDGETFSDTLSRMLRDTILKAAAAKIEFLRGVLPDTSVTLTHDNPTRRRERYKAKAELVQAGRRVYEKIEEGSEPPEEYPVLVKIPNLLHGRPVLQEKSASHDLSGNSENQTSHEKSASQGQLAFPSVAAASLALRGGTQDNTGEGEPTTKTLNLASAPAAPSQSGGESAGKLEQFSEDLANSGFLSEGGLDKNA